MNDKKILFKEIDCATHFLGSLWLFDTNGDHISISPWTDDKQHMSHLYARLRDIEEDLANQRFQRIPHPRHASCGARVAPGFGIR